MDDDSNEGITLQNMIPLDEEASIDWTAVLRDFAWVHALWEAQNTKDQEFLSSISWGEGAPHCHGPKPERAKS